MTKCPICGTKIYGYDSSCPQCGADIVVHDVRVAGGGGGAKTAAAVIVIILVVAGIGYFIASEAHSSYVTVNVYSTHISQTVDVAIYIDGKQVEIFKGLKPGYVMWNTYQVKIPLFDQSKVITVSAVSFGGGLGSQTDSKTFIVDAGNRHSVSLYV